MMTPLSLFIFTWFILISSVWNVGRILVLTKHHFWTEIIFQILQVKYCFISFSFPTVRPFIRAKKLMTKGIELITTVTRCEISNLRTFNVFNKYWKNWIAMSQKPRPKPDFSYRAYKLVCPITNGLLTLL